MPVVSWNNPVPLTMTAPLNLVGNDDDRPGTDSRDRHRRGPRLHVSVTGVQRQGRARLRRDTVRRPVHGARGIGADPAGQARHFARDLTDCHGHGVAGQDIAFALADGMPANAAILSAPSAKTDANGVAQVMVTPTTVDKLTIVASGMPALDGQPLTATVAVGADVKPYTVWFRWRQNDRRLPPASDERWGTARMTARGRTRSTGSSHSVGTSTKTSNSRPSSTRPGHAVVAARVARLADAERGRQHALRADSRVRGCCSTACATGPTVSTCSPRGQFWNPKTPANKVTELYHTELHERRSRTTR